MFEQSTELTRGQRRALDALVGGDKAVTRKEAARSLGISVWNLNTQIQRVKERSPIAYRLFQLYRTKHLGDRHADALERKAERDHQWFLRKGRAERWLLRMINGQAVRGGSSWGGKELQKQRSEYPVSRNRMNYDYLRKNL